MCDVRCLERVVVVAVVAGSLASAAGQSAVGTAFTYQGQLSESGQPISGVVDFQFSMWDSEYGGGQLGGTVQLLAENVEYGLFAAELDFGDGVLTGSARWLEVSVRFPAGSGAFLTMLPRQRLTPSPYALALPGFRTQEVSTSPNVIGGSEHNAVGVGFAGATICGGGLVDNPNIVAGDYSVVVGGRGNEVSGSEAAVVGGLANSAQSYTAAIGGGKLNVAAGMGSNVSGGWSNSAFGNLDTIGGGSGNVTSNGTGATIAGGYYNTVTAPQAVVGGGNSNIASGAYSFVGGGVSNRAAGMYSIVPGGHLSEAWGECSFAAGRRATANHDGTFIWADSTSADFASSDINQFLIRASGGVGIGTSDPVSQLHVVGEHSTSDTGLVTATNTTTLSDSPAVYGQHNVDDYYGVGVCGKGGYMGVRGDVVATGANTYYGLYGTSTGGAGTNYGVYGRAWQEDDPGSFETNLYGGYFSSSGERQSSGVCGENTGFDVLGHLGYVGSSGEFPIVAGVYGTEGAYSAAYAGYFQGDVAVSGTLSKAGGSFKIDHPLDPKNKYLSHSFVESPDMMNIYNGNITTDSDGMARVVMPEWFDALNRDYRYQLTVIGSFAHAIIAEEYHEGYFVVRTDEANVKVSWQITGIRQDKWADANRIPVEEFKQTGDRGKYLHPAAFGLPEDLGIAFVDRSKPGSASKDDEKNNHHPLIHEGSNDGPVGR